MKHVLNTSGAGFLGSHLSERYLNDGWKVTVMDNLLTGHLDNIAHLMPLKEFHFMHQDVTEFVHVTGPLDLILHFASPASPIDYLEMPIQTLKVCAMGTHKVLGLAKAKGARFLLTSSSEVYGDPLTHQQKEEYWGKVNPIGTRGVYDEDKRFAEAITMAYHRYHKVDTLIILIFNTNGQTMRLNDGRLVPAYNGQALSGEALTILDDEQQARSICYVDDLFEGIVRLAANQLSLPVNIGNSAKITFKQFAKEILAISGSISQFSYIQLPADDPKVYEPGH